MCHSRLARDAHSFLDHRMSLVRTGIVLPCSARRTHLNAMKGRNSPLMFAQTGHARFHCLAIGLFHLRWTKTHGHGLLCCPLRSHRGADGWSLRHGLSFTTLCHRGCRLPSFVSQVSLLTLECQYVLLAFQVSRSSWTRSIPTTCGIKSFTSRFQSLLLSPPFCMSFNSTPWFSFFVAAST
jgi:hypothetical protein